MVLSNTDGHISTDYGHNVIDFIDIEIGGQLIDRHYGHFMEAWAELTENNPTGSRAFISGIQETHHQLINNASSTSTISNLPNYFTKFQAMACAGGVNGSLQPTEKTCQINQDLYVPLRFWFCKEPGLALPLIALQYHEVKIIVNFSDALQSTSQDLWCDYIYLDTDERRRFAQVSHEYLIEQVQLNTFSVGDGAQTYDLNFNHPVKELIWCKPQPTWNIKTHYLSSFNTLINLNKGPNILLKLNRHDRFEKRNITYFTNQQVCQYHTGKPVDHIDSAYWAAAPSFCKSFMLAVYSFCLKPEEHQPSGTCNFSRIDSSQLITDGVFGNGAGSLYIYAINYNVLRIMGGMGGLAYSN